MSEVEKYEVLLLTSMDCSGSLIDIVQYGYCNLIVDDLIEHSQACSPSAIFQCVEASIFSHDN